MLFRQETLNRIRNGTVTVAFRRWRRTTVRSQGTLLTAAGELQIGNVSLVAPEQISAADSRAAGYESREALLAELNRRAEGEIYRIELGALRADPRVALRESPAANEAESQELLRRLDRLDARANGGPWTLRILEVISSYPEIRAGDLCKLVDQEKAQFKLNVRKLKSLGLTESLETGYRLSPRGVALLEDLRSASAKDAG